MNQKKRVLQIKSKSPEFQATTNIQVRVGGRMRFWQKGEGIELDEETIRQYFHPNDYEKIPPAADRRPNTAKPSPSGRGQGEGGSPVSD